MVNFVSLCPVARRKHVVDLSTAEDDAAYGLQCRHIQGNPEFLMGSEESANQALRFQVSCFVCVRSGFRGLYSLGGQSHMFEWLVLDWFGEKWLARLTSTETRGKKDGVEFRVSCSCQCLPPDMKQSQERMSNPQILQDCAHAVPPKSQVLNSGT